MVSASLSGQEILEPGQFYPMLQRCELQAQKTSLDPAQAEDLCSGVQAEKTLTGSWLRFELWGSSDLNAVQTRGLIPA